MATLLPTPRIQRSNSLVRIEQPDLDDSIQPKVEEQDIKLDLKVRMRQIIIKWMIIYQSPFSQVDSSENLRDAIAQIQRQVLVGSTIGLPKKPKLLTLPAQLIQRKNFAEEDGLKDLIKKQFSHIQEQFVPDSKYVPLSLEHLELYQNYLLRLDEGLPGSLEDERTKYATPCVCFTCIQLRVPIEHYSRITHLFEGCCKRSQRPFPCTRYPNCPAPATLLATIQAGVTLRSLLVVVDRCVPYCTSTSSQDL